MIPLFLVHSDHFIVMSFIFQLIGCVPVPGFVLSCCFIILFLHDETKANNDPTVPAVQLLN